MTDRYVELHARSAFSFLEGASLPEAMTQQDANLELPCLAILDRDGLYGSPRLYTTAKKLGLRSHIGAEVSVDGFGQQVMPAKWQPHTIPSRPVRLSLLCESQTGYRNLSMLISSYKLAQRPKGDGVAPFRSVQKYAEGLVCMTGGDEGPLAAALERGGMDQGRTVLERLVQTFGPKNVYVELQRHGICEQEARNQAAIALAREFHLPLLATNGVSMATEFEREVLDVLTSIRHGCSLDEAGLLLQQNGKRHLRSAEQMCALFRDLPEAIGNTGELSDKLSFLMKDMGYEFPRYPIPEGDDMDSFLRKRTVEGVARRYRAKSSASLRSRTDRQVDKELALIQKLGLAGYFLIVWDILEFCRKNGILVQGRGSAANSAVCYALGITAVDPVGMELLFERFLSEVRGEWPDIDLDLPSGDDRERAIQYVYDRYGQLGAAMCANVITYRGRSAAREVGKSLGFDADMQTRLTRLVGSFEWRGPTDTMAHHFQQAGFDLDHPRIAKYLELSIRMLDLPRHLGQHSGGMIIAQGQLASVVPIEPASMPGRNVVQWDKEDCADMGLIKVDLLGLGMMAVLKDCVELIPKHYGKQVDIAQIPHDDPKVFESLRRADTIGLFQVESRAQMASLPRNNPDKFYDLVVQVAIIRPGPIVGQMMNPYMERRQGRQEIEYPHDLLEPVLKRTLGVPLFQEQLLRMAMVIANFTGGEAEELRRALGSRRSQDKMKALEIKLRAGMDANGVGVKAQEETILAISSFALYGFPESHAASFALIAYASAWLKFHYLPVFTAAILNNQPMGFYSAAVLVKDAQRHDLRIKPVDVLRSEWNCILKREPDNSLSLRLGLRYVRGLSARVATEIERIRAMRPFGSIEELARRVPSLSQADLATLAETGALNSLGEKIHRRDALWQVERAGRQAGPLLAELDGDEEHDSPLQAMEPEERMVADYAGTGVTVGRHPMWHCRSRLREMSVFRAGDLKLVRHGIKLRIAGQVIARQRPGTAHGFIFLSLEDETGIANAIVDPDLFMELGEGIWQNREPYKTGLSASAYAEQLPAEIVSAETTLVCMDSFSRDLQETGYLHNHARLWFAAYIVHWRRSEWQAGARWFLEHLIDGDPASNNLSWQWVASTFSRAPYIFNRENLQRYTDDAYCSICPHAKAGSCPFDSGYEALEQTLFPQWQDRTQHAGPVQPVPYVEAVGKPVPRTVNGTALHWHHTDSLNPASPMITAHPDAPAVFVWDTGWLIPSRISMKRVQFIAESLLKMPGKIDLRVGEPAGELIAAAQAAGADYILAQRTPDPRLLAAAAKVGQLLPVLWYDPPAFVETLRGLDLKRFSRYWKRAQSSAMQRTGSV